VAWRNGLELGVAILVATACGGGDAVPAHADPAADASDSGGSSGSDAGLDTSSTGGSGGTGAGPEDASPADRASAGSAGSGGGVDDAGADVSPGDATDQDAPTSSACPRDPGMVEPCSTLGQTCVVAGACCVCEIVPVCGDSPAWSCVTPSDRAECGTAVPEVGSGCSAAQDRPCNYCANGAPMARQCIRNMWIEVPLRICR
jgi:hypothetical protein